MESQAKQFINTNGDMFECITGVTGAFIAYDSSETINGILFDETISQRYFYGDTIYYFADGSCITRIGDEYFIDVDSSMFEE